MRFAVFVLGTDAKRGVDYTAEFLNIATPLTFEVPVIALRTTKDIDEGWKNLDIFPERLARDFYSLKLEVFNHETVLKQLGEGKVPADNVQISPETNLSWVKILHSVCTRLLEICEDICKGLDHEIDRDHGNHAAHPATELRH